MKENITSALLTAGITVLTGFIVFICSQIFLKYVLEPLSDYRRHRAKISNQLVYYANIYTNLVGINAENEMLMQERFEVSKDFRRLASDLIGIANVIPCYGFFVLIRLIPSRSKVNNAAYQLIGISNTLWSNADSQHLHQKHNEDRRIRIIKNLRIKS